MKLWLSIISLWAFAAPALTAQVYPPDLYCLRGDTIIWGLPNNTCGSFNSYEIWYSTDYYGPYTLLASVTNPGQTDYVHPNPGSQVFYYYMTGNYDCPGEPVLSSDTIDNLLPVPPLIQSVTVIGDDVQLAWDPSPSPEVYAYMVYRLIGSNVDVIDTVFAGNSYLDTGASPAVRSEEYYVLALDHCGNTSLFLDPHKTILLRARADSCRQSVLLEWNPYENWPGGIGRQIVWLSIGGGAFQPVDTLGPESSSYEFMVTDEGAEHCFYLQADENGSSATSNSCLACAIPTVITPMEDLAVKNTTFTPSGPVRLDWVWREEAEIAAASVWRSVGDPGNMSLLSNLSFALPLDPASTFEDPAAPQDQGPVYYEIRTTDRCGAEVRSTLGATLYLEGETGTGFTNRLQWQPWELENSVVQEYELYRVVNGVPQPEATLDPAQTTYTDEIDPRNPDEARVCYYLLARGGVYLPEGNPPVASRSNTVCLDQNPVVLVPNAFAPHGLNREFRPAIRYPNAITSYNLQIFDRYGQQVFESADWSEGWDGKVRDRLAPQGVYVYRLHLTYGQGGVFQKDGTVVLLH